MKKTLIAVSAVTSILAAVPPVQAAPTTCVIAGDYQGKYDGPDDHGILAVSVSASDGTLVGKAQSQVTGATFAVGGVVNSDGTLTTSGAVSSGAKFNGRFVSGVASGRWSQSVAFSDGTQRMLTGNWGVERVAADADCQ
ncbi:hypothetical protein M3A49_35380 [Paraburkholderia sp. CNPSo 3076]|uniref:hypothetical protein n=1 Tax=Paraburkholderia sp. CNPSo 3076 TaxID=2940936 RepID=UPI0022570DBB|nr:hypothetical protein [Paraburkholderia sp. CNPSo 3076]MCX5544689.1 hypothetical protein [Paraburkholderia sp. CNPSo 3076]